MEVLGLFIIIVIIVAIISYTKNSSDISFYKEYGKKNNFGTFIYSGKAIHHSGHPYLREFDTVKIVVYEKKVCIHYGTNIQKIPPQNITRCEISSETKWVDKNWASGKAKNHYALNCENLILSYMENEIEITMIFTSHQYNITDYRNLASAINRARVFKR